MIYNLLHTTTYDYTNSVSLSHHTMHLEPRTLPRQHCYSVELKVEPIPATLTRHVDYFGNRMTFATVEGAHKSLIITARSRVEILPYTPPMADETTPWDRVEPHCRENSIFSEDCLGALEFLYPTSLIKKLPVFREYTMPSFPEDRPVLEAVMDLTCRIHKDFKFDPKATTVATPLEEVMKNRRGVCQDFAQLQIACLRTMNIPARYVSGYLETDPPPGKPRLVGADASHAWVSFFSPDHGWIDVDPTNNLLPSSRHITVAWGRDYNDVSPVRGVILGSGDHSLKVSVDVAQEMEKNI